jgi:hypothetical protein
VRSSLQHQDESMGDRAHLSSLHSRRRGPPLRYSFFPHASKPEKNVHKSHNPGEHHALYSLHTQITCPQLAQETDQQICPPCTPPRSQSPSAVSGSTSLPSNLFSEHPKLLRFLKSTKRQRFGSIGRESRREQNSKAYNYTVPTASSPANS